MKVLCDRCDNYEVSACGCYEKCWAVLMQNNCIVDFTKDDFNDRLKGVKKHCKYFNKFICNKVI